MKKNRGVPLMNQIFRQMTLCLLAAGFYALGGIFQGCSASSVRASSNPTSAQCNPASAQCDPQAAQVPIFTQQRLLLTSEYSRVHYGNPTSTLTDPELIVVHYTAIPDLKDTLRFFEPAQLDRQYRNDIARGGDVNVSAHYVVDTNGGLYQLAPEDVICRHTIGFNQTAIGIENLAADADHLSDKQAQATAGLISRVVGRHPTIRYLIGHHEYRESSLPHYKLFVEHDASYRFTDKMDPGPLFMARVRQLLKERYGLTLSD
jgi:N-acetylmuramoyl-L-alanine amidase